MEYLTKACYYFCDLITRVSINVPHVLPPLFRLCSPILEAQVVVGALEREPNVSLLCLSSTSHRVTLTLTVTLSLGS
jgi:hypothetical protein